MPSKSPNGEQLAFVSYEWLWWKKDALDFLEELGSFLACFFGVVDRHMGGFLGAFSDVLAPIGRGVTGQLKCVLRAVRGLGRYRLAGPLNEQSVRRILHC
jgi:hypothetical protein